MRLFDGRDILEFERAGTTVTVLLGGSQIRRGAIDVVRQHAVVQEDAPEDYAAVLEYALPTDAVTLRRAASDAKTRISKLRTAQKLSAVKALAGRFAVPFLHPENVVLTGAGVSVTHFGLVGIVTPMSFDEALFLKGYKALVLSIFHPRLSFEKLVDGSAVLGDRFSQRIASCETVDELASFIDAELAAEAARAARDLVSVPKSRYRLIAAVAAAAVVATAVLGWFTYTSYSLTQPKQEAIVTAQSHFLTSDYAQTLADLQDYSPADLPTSARYVLAVSAVKLTDLTGAQKQAVLDNISTKTDDNTLNYWIFLARGELEQALDRAKNVGDDQLTLLAYTDLYQATKLNTRMDGARKQKLLEEYAKNIEDLTARLGAAQ